jgi:YHS domain-containing protein
MNKTVTDPVCGMHIEPQNAAAQTTYRDQTYYFCSQECKDKFDKEPQKYIDQMMQTERRH